MSTTVTLVGRGGAAERRPLSALMTADLREQAREESYQWIKRLRLVSYDGASMRERFTYGGDALWWFTELYLHKMRRLDTAVATILALARVHEAFDPARIVLDSAVDAAREAALAFGRAHGVPVEAREARRHWRSAALPAVTVVVSRIARLRRTTRREPGRARVAAFVHRAFWRRDVGAGPEQESYIGPILDELQSRVGRHEMAYVGLGPSRNFRARRWWHSLADASAADSVIPVEQLAGRDDLAGSSALWRERRRFAREIVEGSSVRAAAIVHGCDLWPILRDQLSQAALIQWPWSARSIDEAGAAIDALAPRVVVTYAEAGGWGRALVIAARRRGIPSVGIQHGFIYRHWLNYRHEADEMEARGADRGFPAPDRTLLFDDYARTHLERAGHLPPSALAVTGSAGRDALARRVREYAADRAAIRRDLGVGVDESLLVLAAKFSEIAEELPALFAAAGAEPGVRLVVKTHPAETESVYRSLAADAPHVAVLPGQADLARLLAAADGLVTMNSTVAIDALVLGVPSLVLGWPTNLSPFVDAGVMLGGPSANVPDLLRRLLYDQPTRDDLRQRAAEFIRVHQMRADGRAASRAADEILAFTT
jgi:hypothetical protein